MLAKRAGLLVKGGGEHEVVDHPEDHGHLEFYCI